MLVKLEESGYGCHIRHIFIGTLSHADDITLFSPSMRGLNEMLHICSIYADNFAKTFNNKKPCMYTIWRTDMSIRNN